MKDSAGSIEVAVETASLVRLPLPPMGPRLQYARRQSYGFRRRLEEAKQATGRPVNEADALHVAAATEGVRRYYSVSKALADAGKPGVDIDWATWLGLNDRCLRFLECAAKHVDALGLDRDSKASLLDAYEQAMRMPLPSAPASVAAPADPRATQGAENAPAGSSEAHRANCEGQQAEPNGDGSLGLQPNGQIGGGKHQSEADGNGSE